MFFMAYLYGTPHKKRQFIERSPIKLLVIKVCPQELLKKASNWNHADDYKISTFVVKFSYTVQYCNQLQKQVTRLDRYRAKRTLLKEFSTHICFNILSNFCYSMSLAAV